MQNVLPSPETPTYTGAGSGRTKRPPHSDQRRAAPPPIGPGAPRLQAGNNPSVSAGENRLACRLGGMPWDCGQRQRRAALTLWPEAEQFWHRAPDCYI